MEYRLYLLDGNDRIRAAGWFPADDDAEAAAIAGLLHGACRDVFDGCEAWLGRRCAFSASVAGQPPGVAASHCKAALALAENLLMDFAVVRQSKTLPVAMADWRASLSAGP